MDPYYTDGMVTLYLGDALEIPDVWWDCDVLVTDPPYGRNWRQGAARASATRRTGDRRQTATHAHVGIAGDSDTGARDGALALWGDAAAVVFGDLLLPCPKRTRQVLIYAKPPDSGTKGTHAGYRRDVEGVYLAGAWPAGLNGDSSILRTGARNTGNPVGLAARYGHPHAKPVDVMVDLVQRCPPGSIADPFAGSGSTLVAARMDGRRAVGVEIEERYCERAARRLSQQMLETA
jgi:site-specific DNA-methyltransferase (adenine-specific)